MFLADGSIMVPGVGWFAFGTRDGWRFGSGSGKLVSGGSREGNAVCPHLPDECR